METCYMCEKPATSKEHAPAKCLFPEGNDVTSGIDYRKNLITVLSCDAHNSNKSKDDEYLLQVLSSSITSSEVGLNNFLTKVARAYERRPQIAKRFIANSTGVEIGDENGNWQSGAAIKLEHDRLDSVLLNCARALYNRETGKKMLLEGQVITPFAHYIDPGMQAAVEKAMNTVRPGLLGLPRKGDNPEVFWYCFIESEKYSSFYLCFYGSSDAFIRFKI